MAEQYDNTNRGIMSRNDRREKDSHPEFTGSINIEGVEYWLNAWVKESGPNSKTPGRKFFSLSVKPKEEQTGGRQRAEAPPMDDSIPDDDVPF